MPTLISNLSKIALKRALLDEQDWKCGWCEQKLTFKNATLDHVIPLSKGGRNSRLNIVAACLKCNGAKGDMMPVPFMKLMARRKLVETK